MYTRTTLSWLPLQNMGLNVFNPIRIFPINSNTVISLGTVVCEVEDFCL